MRDRTRRHVLARGAVHHALLSDDGKGKIKKETGKGLKRKEGKKVRAGFSKALAAFFTSPKTVFQSYGMKSSSGNTEVKESTRAALENRIQIKTRASRSRARFVFILALPVGVLSIMPWAQWLPSHIEAVKLYPSTCLGGWENPMNAEGSPSLRLKSSSDQFNDRNSAVLRNVLAQIFCGDFANAFPAFPEGEFPKKMFLKFSWVSVAAVPGTRTFEIPVVASASTAGAVLDGPFVMTEEASTSGASTPTSAATGTEELIPAEEPVSFFKKFLNIAFAASASGTVAASSTVTSASSMPEPHDLPNTDPSALQVFGPDFLQVLYTLDGQNWKQLGMVTRENLADLSFQVPVSDPETLSHFQVSIQNVISLDDSPDIYLDALWLEAGE